MSYIPCSEICVHQKDGFCCLERVPDWHGAAASAGGICLYCEASASSTENGVNRLTDIADRDELQL